MALSAKRLLLSEVHFSIFLNECPILLQTERSFLKQSKVFLSTKKSSKGKAPGKAGTRFWKNVGLGFKTPREAIEGEVCAILLKQWFLVGGLCWLHKAARV